VGGGGQRVGGWEGESPLPLYIPCVVEMEMNRGRESAALYLVRGGRRSREGG
jgi:hypothetical protein